MTESNLQAWIGRTETVRGHINAAPTEALAATLNRDDIAFAEGMPLPPLWHWIHFLEKPRTDDLGRDGHTERGSFMPPVTLPRRMWAGSRLQFHRPLRIGEQARRTSRIASIVEKQGRSGDLVIVTIEHCIEGESGLALTEDQDVVYREPWRGDSAHAATPDPAPALPPEWSVTMTAGPVLLFRYSALTFNSHRIHYDQPYATETEGYPGLIVHGPLIPTLLLEELRNRHPDRSLTALSIRALRPLFHGTPFQLQGGLSPDGETAELWCLNEDGAVSLRATAVLAP